MTHQTITVQLDDETIRSLAALGEPIDVLARLAHSAADGVRRPGDPRRALTDQSLQTERDKTDIAIAKDRDLVEGAADDVVRLARERADELVQGARADADAERRPPASARSERARADGVLEGERSAADAVVERERAGQRRRPDGLLADEREATDNDLSGERAHIDTLVVEQREANEHMVRATIRAQELTIEADEAKERAEESKRELVAVAEFREMFIAILGHDLRTPLSTIVMAAGLLLQRGHLDEQDGQTVARIIRSSQRMTTMIAQLLDLTRARLGGGLRIEPTPTDLGALCSNVVGEFEAPIELEVEGDMQGTWDDDRLAEAVSNLAGNAVKYAEPGTAVVIKARPEGDEVVVEVANRGTPIAADVLPFIFEPFRRAEQRKKSRTGSLGLGLYIADQIVIAHGGTLVARCADGTTTFVMRLPRHVSAQVD